MVISARPPAYTSMSDWLDEIEGFHLRIERMPEGAYPWVETAWNLATDAEAEACASICDKLAADPAMSEAARDALATAAVLIRARRPEPVS
ncbi:MAG: hypothetical protein P9E88_05285 [Candidatus Competibacter sp.]|nr:hypothetical protein [Candidatus Competibacter sp.]